MKTCRTYINDRIIWQSWIGTRESFKTRCISKYGKLTCLCELSVFFLPFHIYLSSFIKNYHHQHHTHTDRIAWRNSTRNCCGVRRLPLYAYKVLQTVPYMLRGDSKSLVDLTCVQWRSCVRSERNFIAETPSTTAAQSIGRCTIGIAHALLDSFTSILRIITDNQIIWFQDVGNRVQYIFGATPILPSK